MKKYYNIVLILLLLITITPPCSYATLSGSGGSNLNGCIRQNGLACQDGQVCCSNNCLPAGSTCCDQNTGRSCGSNAPVCCGTSCRPAGSTCCDQNTGDFCGGDEPTCCGTRCLPAGNICCSDMDGIYGCENGTTCTDSNPICRDRCRPEGQVCVSGGYCPTAFPILCRAPDAIPPGNRCFPSGSVCCGAGDNAYSCPPTTDCCGTGCTPPHGTCCAGGAVCNPYTQAQIDALIEQGHLPAGTDAGDFNPPVCCGMGCCPRGSACSPAGECLPPPEEPIVVKPYTYYNLLSFLSTAVDKLQLPLIDSFRWIGFAE